MTNPTDPRIEAAFRAAWNEPCLLGDPIACHALDDAIPNEGETQTDAMKAVIRRMVEAALKAADAAAWQPIESAPKDGETAFDIWVTSKEGGYRIANVMRADEVWVFDLMEWPDEMVPATHWMPLPHPPEAKP